MGDCCQSPDEKLRRVKPAGGSGMEGTKLIRAVYGIEESTCRNCEDFRGLSPKQKEVSPSSRVSEHVQRRKRPKGLPQKLLLCDGGTGRELGGKEASRGIH